MDGLVLVFVLILTVAVGAALARGVLGLILHLLTERRPRIAVHWRPVVFVGALFWFWYLTPAIAENLLASRVLLVLAP